MSIPKNITKDHLLKAINKIDQEGIPPTGQSRFYDVIHEDKKYPPKLVVAYANLFANGEELDRNQFSGGKGSHCFKLLEENNFSIVPKNGVEQPERKVWFVAQGGTFKPERGMNYLWAPEKNKNGQTFFHWSNVQNVQEGDIIFNYSGGLRGVSIAKSSGYPAENTYGDSQWEMSGYRVDIELKQLDHPIPGEQIKKNHSKIDNLLNSLANKPFTKEGKVNQGYLYEFTKEAGRFIRDIYGKPFGVEEIDDFFDAVTIDVNNNNSGKMNNEISKSIEHATQYITSLGYRFNKEEIANFYLSLKTKPFVILAGISGTGKTQLPRKFAEALGLNKEQVIQIPVRPDWTDGSDLLGYVGLDENFKPKALTSAIITATTPGNENKPYFFILDEMNLARVEHYFSDFLSIIETREWKDKIKGNSIITDAIIRKDTLEWAKNADLFKEMKWPDNLFLIGTVNMDETTHAFSRKVLDRANTIEMNEVDLNWIAATNEQIEPLEGIDNSFFKTEFLESIDLAQKERDDIKPELNLLIKVNEILKEADLHFAYRVRDEVAFYLTLNKKYGLLKDDQAFDFQLFQKVLPRIHGSSERIQRVLVKLLNLLEKKDFNVVNPDFNEVLKLNKGDLKYPRSSRKIIFMLNRYEEDRFTSFWL